MTIYRIYADNGNRAGFWVQHRSWNDRCALVQTVAGKPDGPLPGLAPLHEDAPIEFRWYDIRSGRQLVDQPVIENLHDKNYSTIAVPWWSRRTIAPGSRDRAGFGVSKKG